MKGIFLALAVIGGLCLTSLEARAANITWTVATATASGGFTFGGTFDYDADTNIYSNINLLINGNVSSNIFVSGTAAGLVTSDGGHNLVQSFATSLTNGGGMMNETFVHSKFSGSTTLSATGVESETPEPGSILLGGSGVLGFALLQLRRRLAK